MDSKLIPEKYDFDFGFASPTIGNGTFQGWVIYRGDLVAWGTNASGTVINWTGVLFHRIDGPAVEYSNGYKIWHLNGNQMEFSEWKREVQKYYDNDEDYLLMLLKL